MTKGTHGHGHGHDAHEHGHDSPGLMDEEMARWYVENYGDDPTNYMTPELAGLAPDDVVLDIGCGNGAAVRKAAAMVPQGRILGVDPSLAVLRFGRRADRFTPSERAHRAQRGRRGAPAASGRLRHRGLGHQHTPALG